MVESNSQLIIQELSEELRWDSIAIVQDIWIEEQSLINVILCGFEDV